MPSTGDGHEGGGGRLSCVIFVKQFFIQEAQTNNIGAHEPHGEP